MRKKGVDNHIHANRKAHKAAKLLDVYIRNNKKQALLVHTPTTTNLQQISSLISNRFRVPLEEQILFHNGQQIVPEQFGEEVELQDKAVIHLVDRRNIQRDITINVRRLNLQRIEQFRIPSAQIIQDFIVRNIQDEEPQKMFFVYTGRQLRKNRSFAEEAVENGSELFCLHEDRDEVKGERRQFYQKKIKSQNSKKEEYRSPHFKHKEEEQTDNVLEHYLPKSEIKEEEHSQEIRPNFKKKSTTQQINLAVPSQPLKKSAVEGNLSIVTQNFQESHSAIGNSNYFNEGSSISQIIPDYAHNPESSKKIEEGSMFQSAFMGLNSQPSQGVHTPLSSKAPENIIPEETEVNASREKQSFSFDARAPEMLQPVANKQLTLLQRQILQVTESQELSHQNTQREGEVSSESKSVTPQSNRNEDEGSIEHQQFEIGEVQNHLLSASAEMKVEDPNSPSVDHRSKQTKHIYIDDDDNNQSSKQLQEVKQQKSQESEGYVGEVIELPSMEDRQDHRQSSKSKEEGVAPGKINDFNNQIEFVQEKQIVAAAQQPVEQVDMFMIEEEGSNEPLTSRASQVVDEKEQLETHGPSSSSNFYSKSSSRVKPSCALPNEYQFGQYNKPLNRPSTQSGCYMNSSDQDYNYALQASKSENNDKSYSESSQKYEQDGIHHHESSDMEVRVVEHCPQIKTQEQVDMLIGSQIELHPKTEVQMQDEQLLIGKEEKDEERPIFNKEGSKIDELNLLLQGSPDSKGNQLDQDKQDKQSNLLSESSNPPHLSSDIKVQLSPNPKENQLSVQVSHENIVESMTSLQQVRLRKTEAEVTSPTALFHNAKGSINSGNLSGGYYIFKSELCSFDSLQFYLSLLSAELFRPVPL